MATLTGLEPATSAVTGRRANQLRYRAKLVLLMLLLVVRGADDTSCQRHYLDLVRRRNRSFSVGP